VGHRPPQLAPKERCLWDDQQICRHEQK
jgi:hypothetical protein